MAEEEQQEATIDPTKPTFPTSRIKKIIKLDHDITRITSEALFLVSGATESFLELLAEKSAAAAVEKKRKTVKLVDLRLAVKRHQPSREFLLDSLPLPAQPVEKTGTERVVKEKAAPANTRRIDSFFMRPVSEEGGPSCGLDGEEDE